MPITCAPRLPEYVDWQSWQTRQKLRGFVKDSDKPLQQGFGGRGVALWSERFLRRMKSPVGVRKSSSYLAHSPLRWCNAGLALECNTE
jgi:hypothetical protein